MSKLKITKKHLISKAYVNVNVNIVGEYSGISEDAAQEYLERMDDINCVLCSAGLEAIAEPDYVIEWSAADEERKFKQKLPVSYVKNLSRACGKVRLVRHLLARPVLRCESCGGMLACIDRKLQMLDELASSGVCSCMCLCSSCSETTVSIVQAATKGTDMTSFVLTPRDKENDSSIKPDEELKAMKEMEALQTSHVVTHSESHGVYIPLEMKMPLQCEKTHPHLKILGTNVLCKLPVTSPHSSGLEFAHEHWQSCSNLSYAGGTVGSSYALLDELIEVAPYLGIHLSEDGSLPASEAARLFDISEKAEGDFGQEITAWLSLHEAAELSITYGTSVVFTPSSS